MSIFTGEEGNGRRDFGLFEPDDLQTQGVQEICGEKL